MQNSLEYHTFIELRLTLNYFFITYLIMGTHMFACAKQCAGILCKMNVQGRNPTYWRMQTIQGDCCDKGNMVCSKDTRGTFEDETIPTLNLGMEEVRFREADGC